MVLSSTRRVTHTVGCSLMCLYGEVRRPYRIIGVLSTSTLAPGNRARVHLSLTGHGPIGEVAVGTLARAPSRT
jgi:hypothetical protein